MKDLLFTLQASENVLEDVEKSKELGDGKLLSEMLSVGQMLLNK